MLDAIFSWNTLWWLLILLYVPVCIGLIAVVLLQKGKGVGFAGAFGIGPGSDTVFGPRASRSLPAKLTTIMAVAFMVLALILLKIFPITPQKAAEIREQLEEMKNFSEVLKLNELRMATIKDKIDIFAS